MRRLLSSVCLLAACRADAPTPSVDHTALVALAAPGDDVVATVEGRPIRASEVSLQARTAGSDARTALQVLVDAEVLVVAALDHRLASDPDVVEAGRAAAVRRFLATGFERDATPDRIPQAEYQRSYDSNKNVFDHPEVVEVSHLVAMAKADEPALRKVAHDKMIALQARAAAAPTDEAFLALADVHPAPGDVLVKPEHFTFPRQGAVEEPFAAAAFALARPGDVSPVVETTYGSHLIRLTRRVPARHVSVEEAKPELRDGVFANWRKRELDRYVHQLIEQAHVEVHAEQLVDHEGGP